MDRVIGTAASLADLGEEVAPGLHAAELRYLITEEWARGASDVLWRRSKLGLHFNEEERGRVARWMEENVSKTNRIGGGA